MGEPSLGEANKSQGGVEPGDDTGMKPKVLRGGGPAHRGLGFLAREKCDLSVSL